MQLVFLFTYIYYSMHMQLVFLFTYIYYSMHVSFVIFNVSM